MKPLLLMTLMLPASGCMHVQSGSLEALCDGTAADRTAHAAALAEDGGDKSVVTGQRLISRLDAGCGDA